MVDCSYSFSLRFGHANLNSLLNKMNHVINFLYCNEITVLGISESWLTSDTTDASLSIPTYTLLRADSPSGARKHGVALYIHNSLVFTQVISDMPNMIVIYLNDYDLYVVTIYRPPSYSSMGNIALINLLQRLCLDKEVVIQGDFNLPTIRWDQVNPLT